MPRLANRVHQSILVKKAPEPASVFQELGCLTPSIDLTRRKRIPNNRQLSNNPSSHPLRRRNQNQSSGFGSLLGWYVLLLGQWYFRNFYLCCEIRKIKTISFRGFILSNEMTMCLPTLSKEETKNP